METFPLSPWEKFLIEEKSKILSIRDIRDFIVYNTYLLTPEVSLYSYLDLEEALENPGLVQQYDFFSPDNIAVLEEAMKDESCVRFFSENLDTMFFIISVFISYETIARILYTINSIDDLRINLGIPAGIRVPTSNHEECIRRDTNVRLCYIITLCSLLKGDLSLLLNQFNDALYISISKEIKVVEEKLKGVFALSKLFRTLPDESKELLVDFINLIYNISRRGTKKARSGLNYEKALLKYLSSALHIKGLRFEPNGKYTDKNVDGRIYYYKKLMGVIESSYQITTSSGQTSKVDRILKKEYLHKLKEDNVVLINLVDGAGWLVRLSDAKKFIEFSEKMPFVWVFTYHRDILRNLVGLIRDLVDFFSQVR